MRRRFIMLLAIGAISVVIGITVFPIQNAQARPTFTGGGCNGCHSGAQTASMMTVTGLPSGTYVPGQPYNLKVTIADTNGASTGQNAFDLIVTSGTLTSSDPNVQIYSATEAKANTAVDLKLATTFNVTWTAPLSGSPAFDVWAVMGDGAGGTLDIWDHEQYSYSAVPEFPMLLLPVVGIGLAVLLASRLTNKK